MIESNNNFNNNFEKIYKGITLFFKQIGIIFLYFFLIIFFTLLFQKELLSKNYLLVNLSNLLINLLVLVIFILIFRKTIIPHFDDFKKNWKNYIKKYYKYWIIGLTLMVISNLIISSQIGMPTNEELNRNIMFEMPIYSLLTMIIIAPITEELMTRILLKNISKKPYLYVFLSGLIFGSLHLISATSLSEIFYIIPYGVLGSSFAAMYYKSNNIWTSIFFHSLHNFIAVLLVFVGA